MNNLLTQKNTSEKITKTITENSINNNKALQNLTNKLELKNDKGILAPYLASFLVNLFKPENESHFKLIKEQNSIRMNKFLMKGGIPVTLYSNMLNLEIVINL